MANGKVANNQLLNGIGEKQSIGDYKSIHREGVVDGWWTVSGVCLGSESEWSKEAGVHVEVDG